MAKIEKIEYYETCPNCGAANSGQETCLYCGTLLIKRRIFEETDSESLEERFKQEDSYLPVIHGKSGKVDTFLKIFCPIFGGVFLLVPTFLCIMFSSLGMMEAWVLGMFSIFWIVGAGSLLPLIISISNSKKCKNGTVITGMVRGYENGLYSINDSPVKIVLLKITQDGQDKILKLNTGKTSKSYALGAILRIRNYQNIYRIEQ